MPCGWKDMVGSKCYELNIVTCLFTQYIVFENLYDEIQKHSIYI